MRNILKYHRNIFFDIFTRCYEVFALHARQLMVLSLFRLKDNKLPFDKFLTLFHYAFLKFISLSFRDDQMNRLKIFPYNA